MAHSTVEDVMHLAEGWGLVRVIITRNSPLVGRPLAEVIPPDGEDWILGIERGNRWLSLPKPQETMEQGDRLVVCGALGALKQRFRTAEQVVSR